MKFYLNIVFILFCLGLIFSSFAYLRNKIERENEIVNILKNSVEDERNLIRENKISTSLAQVFVLGILLFYKYLCITFGTMFETICNGNYIFFKQEKPTRTPSTPHVVINCQIEFYFHIYFKLYS